MNLLILICSLFVHFAEAQSPLSDEFHKSWKLMVQHQSHHTFQNLRDPSLFITVSIDKLQLKSRAPSSSSGRQAFLRQLGHKQEKALKAKKYLHTGYRQQASEQTFLYKDRRGRKRRIEQHQLQVKQTLISYTLLFSPRSSKDQIERARAFVRTLTYTDFTQ